MSQSSTSSRGLPRLRLSSGLVALVVLAGCASTTHRAPVEERRPSTKPPVLQAAAAPAPAAGASSASTGETLPPPKPLPGAENAGKPGYYSVKPGDTLIRISLDNGQNWRDLARWNGLDNPNVIEVGQVLRVVTPAADPNGVVARPIAAPGRVDAKPLDAARPASAPASAVASAGPPASAAVPAAVPAPAPAPVQAAAPRDTDEDVSWAWPAAGPVATGFDEIKSKGLAIAGKAGDPVLAAADGRVVYAGSGLRGYGNLVIVKHNATFLTAYAHNQTLLVKEDQAVRKGQKIAEMGSSDADRVQLHFEIRRQGKPVDPAKLLPPR